MNGAYYNDNDPFVCEWIRNLIKAGLVAPGEVDCRPIEEVAPDDIKGFIQCHWFSGIAGWPYALQLAGWPDDKPVWTGSCPCQPFSSAGQRQGHADKRHLWPAFFRLIAECRPPVVFGEQVASNLGREWLAGVRLDLESVGYACGGADLSAAGVRAPHIRQRLWWVGYAEIDRERPFDWESCQGDESQKPSGRSSVFVGLDNAQCNGWQQDTDEVCTRESIAPRSRKTGGLGNPNKPRLQGWIERSGEYANQWTPWATSQLVSCEDGKARRIEPGICPLVDGVPGRVGRLRAYGNAIVPQLAAVFIQAANDMISQAKRYG